MEINSYGFLLYKNEKEKRLIVNFLKEKRIEFVSKNVYFIFPKNKNSLKAVIVYGNFDDRIFSKLLAKGIRMNVSSKKNDYFEIVNFSEGFIKNNNIYSLNILASGEEISEKLYKIKEKLKNSEKELLIVRGTGIINGKESFAMDFSEKYKPLITNIFNKNEINYYLVLKLS